VTAADFRRIALNMPGAVEGSHFGNTDLRVGVKIFATLALESEVYGVLLLTPEQQAGMVEDEPKVFSLVPGGWGGKAPPEYAWRKWHRTYWKARCGAHGGARRRSGACARDPRPELNSR
jgi:hypothetical protein